MYSDEIKVLLQDLIVWSEVDHTYLMPPNRQNAYNTTKWNNSQYPLKMTRVKTPFKIVSLSSTAPVKMLAAGCFLSSQSTIDVSVLAFMVKSLNGLENEFYRSTFSATLTPPLSGTLVCLHDTEVSRCVTVLRRHPLWKDFKCQRAAVNYWKG